MAVLRKKKHMDEFLREVFKRYIAIKDADYKKSQSVFTSVFDQVKQKMSERDNYYGKYSSQVMNAGSVYDGIKVGKLDEFDVDIVIRLPINYEDGENGIVVENHKPGFVKMKIANAFDNLDKQPDWEKCHVVTRDWRDGDKYFLQNKFRYWMHSIVQKAVNDLNRRVTVNNVDYLLDYKESGPAYTLNIRNVEDGEPFSLDVDLVPVIKMSLPRWPEGYRSVEGSQVKDWLVVPKPLKSLNDKTLRNRCWRLAFHDFERELLKGCELLKFTIRLLKKLRDSFDMKNIASYYIKTLFLWKIDEIQDKKYWQNKVTVLFIDMVQNLYDALKAKRIRYYWHEDHNLIEALKPTVLKVYCDKLSAFLDKLRGNDVDSVVACLLLPDELAEFKKTEFYKSFPATLPAVVDTSLSFTIQRQDSVNSVISTSGVDGPKHKTDDSTNELLKEILASNKNLESKFESLIRRLENKVESLSATVDNLKKSIVAIEMKKTCANGATGEIDTACFDINDKLKELKIGAKSLRDDAGDVALQRADLGEMVLNVMSNLGDLTAAATIPETETELLIQI